MALRVTPLPALAVACAVLVGGCAQGGGDFTVTITARAQACELSRTRIPAGRTQFVVRNQADLPVTVSITKPVGASRADLPTVEPGGSDATTAGLVGGDYTVACALTGGAAPTAALLVTGDRSEAPPASQTVALTATDTTLVGPESFRARAGDRVGFDLRNDGTVAHALRVVGPDGTTVAELAPVDAGATGSTAASLDRNGAYVAQLLGPAGDTIAQHILVVGR
jgi:hypothetical protein